MRRPKLLRRRRAISKKLQRHGTTSLPPTSVTFDTCFQSGFDIFEASAEASWITYITKISKYNVQAAQNCMENQAKLTALLLKHDI